jgi:ABC-type Fe3+-hydroxamate transport system substrate-binding protein
VSASTPRLVSLVPSVTETLVGWSAPPVACTRFCEQPDLPHVGGTKNPDVDAIVALAPDAVVMCVEENRREDFDALRRADVPVTSLSVDSVADVAPAMRALAAAAAVDAATVDPLVEAIQRVAASSPAEHPRLRAFVPIWRRPWMTLSGGTYGSSLLRSLGVVDVFADAASRYPEVGLDDVVARQPDVVLAPSEPYPFAERHVAELSTVAPVTLVDGQDLFWWGARTPDAARRLAAQLDGLT